MTKTAARDLANIRGQPGQGFYPHCLGPDERQFHQTRDHGRPALQLTRAMVLVRAAYSNQTKSTGMTLTEVSGQ